MKRDTIHHIDGMEVYKGKQRLHEDGRDSVQTEWHCHLSSFPEMGLMGLPQPERCEIVEDDLVVNVVENLLSVELKEQERDLPLP
jgi:hypothetical protein